MSDVTVSFGARDEGLAAALGKVQKQVAGMQAGIQGAIGSLGGLAALTAGTAFLKGIADEFGRVRDLSDRFGESAESIQRVGFAAKQSGADIEVIATSIGKATRNASEATQGNRNMADAFAELGINAAEFVNLPMEEKLAQLSASLMSIKGPGDQLRLALEVLGKSGAELLPLLKQGPDALRESMESATVATQAQVEKMDDLADRLAAIKTTIGVEVGGAAVFAADKIKGIGAGIGDLLALASGVPLSDVQEAVMQRQIEEQASAQKASATKKPIAQEANEITAAIEESTKAAERFSEIWDKGVQGIRESVSITEEFKHSLTPAVDSVSDIGQNFFDAATQIEGLSSELEASLNLSKMQAEIAEKEAAARDESVNAVKALKQEIATQREKLSAAQTAQAAAQQQLQTIAGADASASQRNQQNRPIRAGAVGGRATQIKAAQTAERLSQQAQEARAFGEDEKADRLEKKASEARAKAFGDNGKNVPEDKLGEINKTVTAIEKLVDQLEKKLPTNSLVP